MYHTKNTLTDYIVDEKNLKAYQDLCKDLLKSPSVFRYTVPASELEASQVFSSKRCHTGKGNERKSGMSPIKKKKALASKTTCALPASSDANVLSDVKAMQKSIISSVGNVNTIDIQMFKYIEPLKVCASDSSVVSDDVLIQVCRKSEKVDEDVASIIGTLLVLPKVYHLANKLPPPMCDAIGNYVRWHPKAAVMHMMVPFLQHCPVTQEQHRDLVKQLTEHCTTPLFTHLLRALSSRDSINDMDLQVFQHLCLKADPQAEVTHTAVLAFLSKSLKSHQSSVKFGQCLLFIVKQMGQYVKDEETLQSVVDSHSSVMKKPIQIHLKKVRNS